MRDPNSVNKAFLKRILQAIVLLFWMNSFTVLDAQVIDEDNMQVTSYGQVGQDSLDYMAQSFYADVWQVNRVGVWLQREALGGQVKFALMGDDNGSPDLNAVLYESPLIEPQDSGQYYYSDSFINLLSLGEKYWVVIDGYQNLLSDGYSTVGVSAQLTDTGEGLWFSNNGGTTWDSIPGIPLAIYVEGDTCLFAADIDPDFPLVCPNNPVSIGADFGYASYLWSTGETSYNFV